MADLFSIGVSGLKAQQAALAVTGQNITNAGTEGYTRQRVEMEPHASGTQGNRFQGSGVRVDQITRIADEFVTNQVRLDTAMFSELDTFSSQIQQIEGILLNENGSLDGALQSFFGALQQASNDPADMASRRMVLGEADNLSARFQTIYGRLVEQGGNVTQVLTTGIDRANELARGIAEINDRIVSAGDDDRSGGVNALLDQRDEMLRELSTFINVTTEQQSDGQLNVFIGKGQALVLGSQVSNLELTTQGQVALRAPHRQERQLVTSALTGGEIGGALRFRDQVLNPAINQLGRIALAVSARVNEVHAGGIDLKGDAGGLVFADLNATRYARLRAVADESNVSSPATISVTIDDPLQVPVSDYDLVIDETGSGGMFVRRQSDGEIVYQGQLSGSTPQTIQFDHLTVTLEAGNFAAGDQYEIQPLRTAAGTIEAVLHDPAALALAGPIRTASSFGNQGDGAFQVGEIFDLQHPIFTAAGGDMPPLLVRFTSDTSFEVLDNSDPANPVPLSPPLENVPYTPGQAASLLPGFGQTFVDFDGPEISRVPGAATVLGGLGTTGNGYTGQTIDLTQVDPDTNSVVNQQSVTVAAGASARQIAAQVSSMPGVTARAQTELTLTNLSNDGAGTPLAIAVNGVDLGNVTTLDEIADAVNAHGALQAAGISASSDGSTLRLRSATGEDVTVQLVGDAADSVDLTDTSGGTLTLAGTGPGNYVTATVGGSVTAWLDDNVSLSSAGGNLMPGAPTHQRADLGFELFMTGRAAVGDTFTVEQNTSGVGDNRNGLLLAGLLSAPVLGDPPVSFTETYGELVQFIGVQSSQSQINRDAAESLLQQSTAQRESISGVNLDEEAANLIKFEQAYNAAAQIISVARDTFNTLYSAVR